MEDSDAYLKRTLRAEQKQQKKVVDDQKKAIENGLYPPCFSMPLSLQFELTGHCNLKCRHCYNRSGDLPPDAMTVERWKELSKEIVGHGGIFECVISGGEPLDISFSPIALKDYREWQDEDRKTLKNINALIKDIQRNGLIEGIGKPELLSH